MKKELVSYEGVHCANCSAPMQGEFCHECGQSIHTVLRPMHHMMEDTLETVLHIDGRVVHTVPPLFCRPGFLTLEYFSGRRQRYIAPFRLMFVLCLLAFFVYHLAVSGSELVKTDLRASQGTGEFAKDTTPEAVRAHYEQMVDKVDKSIAHQSNFSHELSEGLLASKHDRANHRLAELGAAPLPGRHQAKDLDFVASDAIKLSWLPDSLNASLNRGAKHMQANILAILNGGEEKAEAQERIMAGVFSVLPQTMFVMMPLFALLLKLTYLLKRRLYMEHLIVALHSHAFLFLAMLIGTLLGLLGDWLVPHAGWLSLPITLAKVALALWVLAYLLLMQKRVYRQGWFLTTVKYLIVGVCYSFLLLSVVIFAGLLGLAR